MEETNAIQWAADLREALKASGTGQAKLAAISAAMAARFDDPKYSHLGEDHPDRHLTAAEAVEVLEESGAGEVTLDKARQLVATGRYKAPPPPTPRGELIPPPPRGPAPARSAAPAERPPLTAIAGPADLVLKEVDTVGPKPVKGEEGKPEPKKAAKKPKRGKGKKAAAEKAGEHAEEHAPPDEPEAEEGEAEEAEAATAGDEPPADGAGGEGSEEQPAGE